MVVFCLLIMRKTSCKNEMNISNELAKSFWSKFIVTETETVTETEKLLRATFAYSPNTLVHSARARVCTCMTCKFPSVITSSWAVAEAPACNNCVCVYLCLPCLLVCFVSCLLFTTAWGGLKVDTTPFLLLSLTSSAIAAGVGGRRVLPLAVVV